MTAWGHTGLRGEVAGRNCGLGPWGGGMLQGGVAGGQEEGREVPLFSGNCPSQENRLEGSPQLKAYACLSEDTVWCL